MEIVIREATVRDYDGLCELIDQVDALHRDHLPHLFQKPAGPVRDRKFILEILVDVNAGLFVAEAVGQLVGFVHVIVQDTPAIPVFVPQRYAIVDTLAVKEEMRRAGIGRALMDRVHQWARSKGACAIELHVYEFNKSAIAFYQSLGYATLSRRMRSPLHPHIS